MLQLAADASGIWADEAHPGSSGIGGSNGGGGGSSGSDGCGLSREQAVVKLQAGARGFLARKHLARQQQQLEQSLVWVQVGG